MNLQPHESDTGSNLSPAEIAAAVTEIEDGILIIDRQWRFVFVNQRAVQIANLHPPDLLGKNIWDLYPALIDSPLYAYYQQVMQTRQPAFFEMEGSDAQNWYEIRVFPSQPGITIYVMDKTEPRQIHLQQGLLMQAVQDARRQAEIAHARLEAVLQQMPSGVILAEAPSGKIIYGNRQVEKILRQPLILAEDIAGYQEFTGYHSDGSQLKPEEWPLARSVMSGEIVQGEEIDYQSTDGSIRILKISSTPITLNGKITAGLMIFDDITEQKEGTRRLRESVARERARASELDAVMDAVPTVVWVTHDPASLEVTGNKAAYDTFRVQPGSNLSLSYPKELTGFKFRVMRQGKELSGDELPLQTSARTGKALRNFAEDIEFEDGSVIHLFGNVAPLLDDEGNPAGAVAAFMDITPVVTAEKALIDSQQRLRVALFSVPITLFTIDLDLKITWAANLPEKFSSEEVLGKRLDVLFTQEEAQSTIESTRKIFETGQGQQMESSIYLEGILTTYILTMEPVFDAQGKVTGITAAALDVTRQRKIESEHREYLTNLEVQRRLMEYREKERQGIARDIHDGPIQNLVSTIFNIQFARGAIMDPVAQVEFEQIGLNIKDAVRELREIINELRPPSLIRFGLSKAIQVHADDFREKQPQINLNLDLKMEDEDLTEQLSLTFFRIYQEALNNIIRHSNASEARVQLSEIDGQIILEIQDNGTGFQIPSDLMEQTVSGHFGLAGMKERADAVGGKFTVVSSTLKGTIVTASAPIQRKN
jgi:PAS domain S-box-containing protein